MLDNDKAILIANLQEQISNYNSQLVSMEAQNPLDIPTYTAIKAERDEAQKKLDSVNAEINAGIEAQTLVSSQFESIMIGNEPVSLRDLTMGENAYQIVSIWIQQYVGDMAQAHAAIVSSYESQVGKLQEDVAGLEIDNGALKNSLFLVEADLEDMTTKRDAAASELAEAQEEQKRLATDNESLRKQLEASNKPSQTNLNTNAADLIAQWKASKPAVYDIVEQSNGNRTAKLLETNEPVVWEKIYPGKYRIASAEEVERFRQGQASEALPAVEEQVEVDTVPDSTLVEPPPAIPSETEDAAVQADTTIGEMAEESVTRVEHEALKARVANIERTLNIGAVA